MAKQAPKQPHPPLPPLKLKIDMVPISAWGQSLRNSIPASKWDKLRKGVHERNGMKCEICGSPNKLHCHEHWDFDAKTGVQKLIGLGTVCSMCHHVAHIGRTKQLAAAGKLNLKAVVDHFLTVNGVEKDVFARHEHEATKLCLSLSSIDWKPDFGEFTHLLPDIPRTPKVLD